MQAAALERVRSVTLGSKASSGESAAPVAPGSPTAKSATERTLRVLVSGRLESGQFVNRDELSCAYEFVVGPDWQLRTGLEAGESQNARNQPNEPERASVVWNFPLETSFLASNVSGWPRIALCVRDKERNLVGYGTLYVPASEGVCTRYCRLFRPLASSNLGESVANLISELPEFYDSRFTTATVGREAVRSVSQGVVKVTIMTRIEGKHFFGYE
jgi:hypothetical protein